MAVEGVEPVLRVAITIVALMCCVPSAHAEDRAQAETFFRRGEKAYQAQDFETAAIQFEEAFKHYALPEIAFSAAQAYRKLYRIKPKPADVARAVELYRIYLDQRRTGGRVADAIEALDDMERELRRLIAAGADVTPELAKQHTLLTISVALDNEPQDAGGGMREVKEERVAPPPVTVNATLDGKAITVPVTVHVDPGNHTVRAHAPGYSSAETTVMVLQGSLASAELRLMPRPARVTLDTNRGARVSVNGRLAGTAPLAPLELAAGKHVITLSMRGREPRARELVVERGQELTLRQPLEMTTRRRSVPWLVAGAGVTLAATGVTATFAYLRDREARDLLDIFRTEGQGTQAERERYERLRAARDHWRMAAYLGGAGVAVLSSLAAILYYTDNPRTDGIRVEPVSVPGGGGAAIAGGF
jgi:hypothetical protein